MLFSTLALVFTLLLNGSGVSQVAAARAPLRRLQKLTAVDDNHLADIFFKVAGGTLEGAQDPELDLIASVAGGAFRPRQLLEIVRSDPEAMELFFNEPLVLAKILEEMPLLTVLPSFKAAAESGSHSALSEGFRKGINELMDLLDAAHTVTPGGIAKAAETLLHTEDKVIHNLVSAAQDGSLEAHQDLRKRFHDLILPELDMQGFRDSIRASHPSKLAEHEDIMHYLDQDPYTSNMIRNWTEDPEDLIQLI